MNYSPLIDVKEEEEKDASIMPLLRKVFFGIWLLTIGLMMIVFLCSIAFSFPHDRTHLRTIESITFPVSLSVDRSNLKCKGLDVKGMSYDSSADFCDVHIDGNIEKVYTGYFDSQIRLSSMAYSSDQCSKIDTEKCDNIPVDEEVLVNCCWNHFGGVLATVYDPRRNRTLYGSHIITHSFRLSTWSAVKHSNLENYYNQLLCAVRLDWGKVDVECEHTQ